MAQFQEGAILHITCWSARNQVAQVQHWAFPTGPQLMPQK